MEPTVQTRHASATGLGDQIVRVKGRLASGAVGVGLATDVRLPTGDEFDFHGAGAYGVKPFGIVSFTSGAVSPHVNVGYEWNGSTVLASPSGTEPAQLPDRVFYVVGFDAALAPRFTLAVDFFDQVVLNRLRTMLAPNAAVSGPQQPLASERVSDHESNLAAGFKARLFGDVVITRDVLVRLNDAGLRARVVPNLGVSYLF